MRENTTDALECGGKLQRHAAFGRGAGGDMHRVASLALRRRCRRSCLALPPHSKVSRASLRALLELQNLPMAEADREVIIHHPGGLHEGVADRRADEFESTPQQFLAHRVGLRRARGDFLHGAASVLDRLVIYKTPQQRAEAAQFFFHADARLRVLDRRRDLQPVADDAGIREQLRDLARRVARDALHIEMVESLAVVFALRENREPTQPRLRALEDEHLEKVPVIMQRHAPLGVVIRDVERLRRPRAAGLVHHLS